MKFSTDRDQIGLTALMVISILIMAGALVVIIWPKPTTTTIQNAFLVKANKAKLSTAIALSKIEASQTDIQKQTWKTGAQIAPQASQLVNALGKQHNVSITAFRPQHSTNTGDLVQFPFSITVQGGYPDVIALEREIEENPKNMLAVEMFQLTGIDESTSKVTGTINVDAYLQTPKASASKTSTTFPQGATNVKS